MVKEALLMILKRCAGVLLHPTSLYGKHGIGDLGQACYEFIDFLHASHQKIWQVLPINPISFGNSPYQSFSTFAKNYLLISPEILLQKKYLSSENLTDIPNFDQYNVDYERVAQFKSNLFRIAFANFCKDIPKKFIEFCEENSDWLDDYSLFLSLKNYFVSYRTKNKNSAEIENDLKKLADMLPLNLVNDYYFGAVWSTWPQDIVQRDKNCLDKWRKIFPMKSSTINFYSSNSLSNGLLLKIMQTRKMFLSLVIFQSLSRMIVLMFGLIKIYLNWIQISSQLLSLEFLLIILVRLANFGVIHFINGVHIKIPDIIGGLNA